MTKATVRIGDKEYKFEGDDVRDALSSVKFSRVPFKIVREMGLKWTRKILWPTFKNLHSSGYMGRNVDISLPKTLRSLVEKKTSGNLNASLDMNMNTEKFSASAHGEFTSEGLSFEFESDINEAERTGNALRESLDLISSYNIDVHEIVFSIDNKDNHKQAKIDIDADVPQRLSQTYSAI